MVGKAESRREADILDASSAQEANNRMGEVRGGLQKRMALNS